MKTIGLVVASTRSDTVAFAKQAFHILLDMGVSVCAEADMLAHLPGSTGFDEAVTMDAIVTLGGDGTLLRGAQLAQKTNAPLLGINLGRTGFLAETEPNLLCEALDALLGGRFDIEERNMLDVSVKGLGSWHAMNDTVLTRGGYARLISLRVLVDGEEAGCYHADGLVVATPTGSTGYSLSAGGPIVAPGVDCMIITPVCAHSLQHRPVVVDGHASIRLELGADDEMTAALQIDGQNRGILRSGQVVSIRKSSRVVRLVRLHDAHFFQLVRQKLAEWSS